MRFLESLRHRVWHLAASGHDHGVVDATVMDSGAEGIRATKVSLIILGLTALVQAVIVVFSGSVSLLSDTVHNVTDAMTSIPLWVAFSLGRRRPTRTYTYGFHRAEDLVGLLIVAAIAVSAVFVIVESVSRLLTPQPMEHIPWVVAAGLIGFLGNEAVARYRIRVGRHIGSEALVTDGRHARTDALTSLAVVAAGVGAAVGADWVDPIAGLVVGVGILWLLARSARRVTRRLLDGVEPELADDVEATITATPGVEGVDMTQVRWHGHQLNIVVSISVDSRLSVAAGHDLAHEVEHALHHRFSFPIAAVIHVEPHGASDAHDVTAHHRH